jgi:hypothetical protein
MSTKIICFYLPQFHETEDNNRWWGKGYTDWDASRNAHKMFKNHNQPRIPLDKRYYDLSEENAITLKWQAETARKYGIYGFCMYHYWFGGKRELEKPVEILRNHKEIDIHYSLCWDSTSWKRTWYADKFEQEVLIEQVYGGKEMWKRHFEDLLPDFKDERYIKINNRPVFHIYRAYQVDCIEEMRQYWDELARENGFDGIYLVGGDLENRNSAKLNKSLDAYYNFEPNFSFYYGRRGPYVLYTVARAGIIKRINKWFHKEYLPDIRQAKEAYKMLEKYKPSLGKKTFLGIFPDYDDTPRRQLKGAVYVNNKIEYFEHCLRVQMEKSEKLGNEFLYINAWNEWGETAYLEPDEEKGYMYLETINKVVSELA